MIGQVGPAEERVGDFLASPPPRGHAVQFYDGDEFLLGTVARFVGGGFDANQQVLVLATRAHTRGLMSKLELHGYAVGRALECGQLVLIDAELMLSQLMVGDMPDLAAFREHSARMLALLHSALFARTGVPAGVRVYGEMVDLLAQRGNVRAAIRLEELWCDVTEQHGFTLLCGYGLESFQHAGAEAGFGEICKLHKPVLPTEQYLELPDAHARLLEISRLQQHSRARQAELQQRTELEAALRAALQAHTTVEEELRVTIKREREARARVEASQAFKEVFLGMLGHDLRNPLNVILTTARLMTMADQADPETKKRVARVVSSSERMHRMIEQILDTTRARLAAGIGLALGELRDLVPIVREVVREFEAAHPRCRFELQVPPACPARVDDARFAQVLQNLLDNAVAHGDRERPIRVETSADAGMIRISVHNHGQPIAAELLPLLFDPFARGGKPQARSAGLGLGLYISQHIVRAHGGNLTVESSAHAGTRFEMRLPCP